jgi:hypothetical protein
MEHIYPMYNGNSEYPIADDVKHTFEGEKKDSLDFETLELLPLLPEEQPEEYLDRVRELCFRDAYGDWGDISGRDRGLNIVDLPKYSGFFKKSLLFISQQNFPSTSKFSYKKNQKTLEAIKDFFSFNTRKVRESNGFISYDHTNITRPFFGQTARRVDDIPYSQSLFLVSGSREFVSEYVHTRIDDKNIALLGGGNSVDDLLSDETIHPKVVVNIDPYITSERSDKGKNYPYVSLPIRAEDSRGVLSVMQERHIDGFDEVWASYSVPYYLGTPDQIKSFFVTIKLILKEGGIARITPLKISDNGSNDGYNEFINQIESLFDSSEYNLYFSGRGTGGTLFIKRLENQA